MASRTKTVPARQLDITTSRGDLALKQQKRTGIVVMDFSQLEGPIDASAKSRLIRAASTVGLHPRVGKSDPNRVFLEPRGCATLRQEPNTAKQLEPIQALERALRRVISMTTLKFPAASTRAA